MKVVFFNFYHNGDVHVSRGIVRKIVEKVHQIDPTITFEYSHRNPPNLITDIPGLSYNRHAIDSLRSDHDNLIRIDDTVFINTWYAQQHFKYMNRYGITIDSLYAALDDSCKSLWNFSLSDISTDISSFFPSIEYSKYEIGESQKWLGAHPETKILVENCEALSGQATNFSMTPIIVDLARQHPTKTFILTGSDGVRILPSNVVLASNIIKKNTRSDLNEISFLSTHCQTIIGRASGPFTFTLTQENLFKRPTKYLCFTNLTTSSNKYWIGSLFQNQINYSANIIVSNESNAGIVQGIINRNI